LLAAPFGQLEELHLGHNTIGVESARALASNDALGSLTTLNLADCGLTHAPAAVAALADVRTLTALRSLDLGHQPLPPHAIRTLVAGQLLRTVESLDLAKTEMTDTGLRAIAAADLPNLKSLRIQDNRITDAGARALVKSKSLTGLGSVWIQDNKLTAKGKAMVKERFGEDGCWV
jgi:Leucine-rich repeat (LRR) protein